MHYIPCNCVGTSGTWIHLYMLMQHWNLLAFPILFNEECVSDIDFIYIFIIVDGESDVFPLHDLSRYEVMMVLYNK